MNPLPIQQPRPLRDCSTSSSLTSTPPIATAARPESIAAAGATQRIAALDFTKGALVLFMVLYHWLNYFVASQGEFYRYLRFLTPSFIFITGFLISNVYLSRYRISDPRLPRRLVQRGLKTLAIFIILNILIGFLFSQSYG